MSGHSPIALYLADLRRSVSGSRTVKHRIVGEIEEHLIQLSDEAERGGLPPTQAEQLAVQRIGSVDVIARQFAVEHLDPEDVPRRLPPIRAATVAVLGAAAIAVTVLSAIGHVPSVEGIAIAPSPSDLLLDRVQREPEVGRAVVRSNKANQATTAPARPMPNSNLASLVTPTKRSRQAPSAKAAHNRRGSAPMAASTARVVPQPHSNTPTPGAPSRHPAQSAQAANLGVSVTGPEFVALGSPTTFRVLVTNTGPGKAVGAEVMLSLPPGTMLVGSTGGRCTGTGAWSSCRVGSIGRGSKRLTKVRLLATGAGVGTLGAFVSSLRADPNSGNNSAKEPIVLQPLPAATDVAVSISPSEAAPNPASSQGTQAFDVKVANDGPGTAVRVLVSYAFAADAMVGWGYPTQQPEDPSQTPRGTTTCGWAPLGPDLDPADANVEHGTYGFCLPSLKPGEVKTFTVELYDSSGESSWSASARPITTDLDLANNEALFVPGPSHVTRQVPLCSVATNGEPCSGGTAGPHTPPVVVSPGVISPNPHPLPPFCTVNDPSATTGVISPNPFPAYLCDASMR
jgi:uncharacterized repeat protein (TIGR01451 family)